MIRHIVIAIVFVAGWMRAPGTAFADELSDAEKIERLQRQTELLQKQLQALQRELGQAKRKMGAKHQQPAPSDHAGWSQAVYRPEPRSPEFSHDHVPETHSHASTQRKEDAPATGHVTFPSGRPTVTSADGHMSLAIGAQVQFDWGGYFQQKHHGEFEPPGARELNDGENLRRGRIYFVGTYDEWSLHITPDFGGSPDGDPTLYEANLNYTIDPLTLTVGYFKPYDTLARSQFAGDALFLERPSIAQIASDVAGGIQRASAGFKVATDDYFIASYFTGDVYGSQIPVLLNDQQTGGTLRLATRPFRGEDWNVHVGFSGSRVFNFNNSRLQPGGTVAGIQLSDQPELRIDFNELIDTGFIPADTANTWGFELAMNWQNFLIQGEYIQIGVDPTFGRDLDFSGWYVEGSWVLTGESRPYVTSSATYARPNPAHPFRHWSHDGGWGAWELAGRYSVTDLNSAFVLGGRQEVASAALSWYPNAHVRFLLQGSHVDVDRLDWSRTVQVGQSFWDLAIRSQVAY